ncbi:hypothetical protein ACROYT_G032750 [Oculina patagonica]
MKCLDKAFDRINRPSIDHSPLAMAACEVSDKPGVGTYYDPCHNPQDKLACSSLASPAMHIFPAITNRLLLMLDEKAMISALGAFRDESQAFDKAERVLYAILQLEAHCVLKPRDGGQGFVLSHNGHLFEPSAEQGTSAQEQQSEYDQANDEQGSRPSPPDKETEQAVRQRMNGEEQEPSYQQRYARQVDGSSIPVPEVEQIANQTVNAHERQPVYRQVDGRRGSGSNFSMLNGVEASEDSSGQEADLVADQLVNGQQHQMLFQQGDGAEANGLNCPTQETDLHASQRPAAPEYQPPHQEADGDQACGYNYPVQETGQVAVQLPGEHEDLPPCYQQLNGFHINGVNSTE